jgi:lipopolysaccharide transport system permease protein
LVTSFFFTRVLAVDVEHFPVFLLVGILAWTLFAAGLQMATGSLESGRSLVLRPGFPTIVLPLVSVLVVFTDYVIALPILFVALAFTVGVSAEALLLPLLLLIQLVFVAGLGLVFAPLQVFFKDTRQFVGVIILAGFWMTPIFYEQKQVPDAFVWLYHVNPMAHLIEAQRDILLQGQLPSALTVGLVALAGCAVFAAGCAVFTRLKYSLPEKL